MRKEMRDSQVRSTFWLLTLFGAGGMLLLSVYADQIWVTREPEPVQQQTAPGIKPTTDYDVVPVYDEEYLKLMKKRIRNADEQIFVAQFVIQSPTLLGKEVESWQSDPVMELCEMLVERQKDGVDVEVWLSGPQTGDSEKRRANRTARQYFQKHGVKAKFLKGEIDLHDKLVLIDQSELIQGSHNWTPAALASNRELSWWMRAVDKTEEWTWKRYREGLVEPQQ